MEKKRERECRRKIAANSKELKRIKKAEKDKRGEREIWARLKELNSNFAKVKGQKNLDDKRKSFVFPRLVYFHPINCKLHFIKNILPCK